MSSEHKRALGSLLLQTRKQNNHKSLSSFFNHLRNAQLGNPPISESSYRKLESGNLKYISKESLLFFSNVLEIPSQTILQLYYKAMTPMHSRIREYIGNYLSISSTYYGKKADKYWLNIFTIHDNNKNKDLEVKKIPTKYSRYDFRGGVTMFGDHLILELTEQLEKSKVVFYFDAEPNQAPSSFMKGVKVEIRQGKAPIVNNVVFYRIQSNEDPATLLKLLGSSHEIRRDDIQNYLKHFVTESINTNTLSNKIAHYIFKPTIPGMLFTP